MKCISTQSLIAAGAVLLGAACVFLSAFADAGGEPRLADRSPDRVPAEPVALTPAVRVAARRAIQASDWPGPYAAPVGRQLTFAVSLTNRLRLTGYAGAPMAADQGLRVAGKLSLTVVDRRDDEILVGADLRDIEVVPLSSRDPRAVGELTALTAPLAGGVTLRMTADGRVHGYAFPAKAGSYARDLVRTVMASFRFIVPADHGRKWTVRDSDATGEFEAACSLGTSRGVVHRSKRRYLSIRNDRAAERTQILSGSARGAIDRDAGWLVDAIVDESVQFRMEEVRAVARSHLLGSLQLVETRDLDPGTLSAGDWRKNWASVHGRGESTAELGRANIERYWRSRLAATTVPGLVAELRSLLVAGKLSSIEMYMLAEKLSWLVKLHPEGMEALEGLIIGAGDLASVLLGALGRAGTPAAQALLVRCHTDASLPVGVREAATMAMFQLATPSSELVDSVLATLRGLTPFDSLRARSLLLVGALAGRDGAPAGTDAALLRYEAQARRLGVTDVWLKALGNAGGPATLKVAERHLSSSDESVRAAAATSLRKLDSARALELLARAGRDPSPVVHSRAVDALGESRSRHAAATLARMLAAETVDARCRTILGGLGRRAEHDASARRALRDFANGGNSEALRGLARILLSQHRASG